MQELEELRERSGKIETAIQDLDKKILNIGGAKLLMQKSKVDGIRLHINIANDEITKAEVAKLKAEKDSAKFATAIENSKAQRRDVKAEPEGLNDQIKECVQYIQVVICGGNPRVFFADPDPTHRNPRPQAWGRGFSRV